MNRLLAVSMAFAMLTGCTSAEGSNEASNDATPSNRQAGSGADNAVATAEAGPLAKEQALALMKARHENYEKIGKAMRSAKKGLDGNDPAAVREAAATIAQLSSQAPGWFPAGTGPEVGKTHAKAEIWQQPQQFQAGMKDFQAAATTFNQAAQGADVEAMKAAHAKLGGTCKACHDRFREKH